jgi:anti-anti-sigma factor
MSDKGNKMTSLKLEENLSIYNVKEIREKLVASLEDADLLELDLTDVKECDTAGLQIICSAKKSAGCKLKKLVISGISKPVEEAMYKSGITHELITQGGGAECQR